MDDYLAIELPPLQTLLENAKGTSIVRYYKKHTEIEKAELKNINRTWLRFIKLNASYQYGQMTDNVLYQEDLPPVYRYQDKTQSWYNAELRFRCLWKRYSQEATGPNNRKWPSKNQN